MNDVSITFSPASPVADVLDHSPVDVKADTLVRLYCGRGVPTEVQHVLGFAVVPDSEVASFIATTLAKAFPNGWSISRQEGGWCDKASGQTFSEPSIVIELVLNWATEGRWALGVAKAWKTWFRQDAVMVTRQALADVAFV